MQTGRPGNQWKILVVGASGYFGKLLVTELLEQTQASLFLAGRHVEHLAKMISELGRNESRRLQSVYVDLHDAQSCHVAVQGMDIVICTAGPYQNMPLYLARTTLGQGSHYIDIADDRSFVLSVRELSDMCAPHAVLCPGWSSMPSLSAVLARFAAEGMEVMKEIHIQIAPGNKAPRSKATVESLLDTLSKQFTVWKNGVWNDAAGWSNARDFNFPAPIGRHRGYLVDVPDHELFPTLFGADTVLFRVGAELPLFNMGVSMLAGLSRAGLVGTWRPLAPFFQTCMSMTGWLGHDWGALGVEVVGINSSGMRLHRRACIVADHSGQRIPVMPATIMTRKLISGTQGHSGLVPLDLWIDKTELYSECSSRGYRLIIDDLT